MYDARVPTVDDSVSLEPRRPNTTTASRARCSGWMEGLRASVTMPRNNSQHVARTHVHAHAGVVRALFVLRLAAMV